MIRPEGTMETATRCPATSRRPAGTENVPGHYQTRRVWLISGCAFGTNTARSRLELQHRLDAAGANGRMRGVLAEVHFPMPAALAFLAVGMNNPSQGGFFIMFVNFELGNI